MNKYKRKYTLTETDETGANHINKKMEQTKNLPNF